MPPRYCRIAIIGTGPSGLSTVKALQEENIFDTIRVFERRDRVGGTWLYDPVAGPFKPPGQKEKRNEIPAKLPQFTPSVSEDTTTGIYNTLDSNVGAKAMAFTHTPFPEVNSAQSVEKLGRANPTRPFRLVAGYLEDLFKDYLHLVSFNTTVEKVEKKGEEWIVTLRRSGQLHHGEHRDYWWQETFDAVVVASGHYSVPLIPAVSGLDEAVKAFPGRFEHSKAYRDQNAYVDKKVVVVGGSISAADTVVDLHAIVKGPLHVSQRGKNEALQNAWDLPNVEIKPTIQHISADKNGVTVKFSDNTEVSNIDKVIYATGYRLSYPFLSPDPVTPNNRVAGFYQHVFKIGDPSLTLVGQVRAAISFRVYEYQAVAVARYFAGRNAKELPSPSEQDRWEVDRLQYKGPSATFHEIKPDFNDYFSFLRDLAGPPAPGTNGYELPPWEDKWAAQGFEILQLKDKYWKGLIKAKL
ncbi:hypothetical protein ASPWEDRAFT_171871 [Aspergillus wentii DTO 134E9]|uniref:FAD/NAD(P)-binding domain-containing protein n=1 Tax=Aspergillus wentii DTO 134E9 TaxID=1073089 RepID=A0A1L9RJG2_ASPWE|nr:uncharacterized protein ASPWEDRAFT_171871 [Aspergillus wentii DTO 134E9]KAI9932001.1 hypothetical protein MW887_009504 [Aspergillus wentii]OJJ35043.1 hypothetical protein ASPWEDRAFT_171871 [Aspergillus wentii DTO 134E9]